MGDFNEYGIVRNKRWIGTKYEEYAARYLESQGFRVICKNFYCKLGEIDMVCSEKVSARGRETEYLVFVEVKYRRSLNKGYAAEAVGNAKQRKILQCAQFYMKKYEIPQFYPIRFDVVAIDGSRITLIRNAFGCM